MNPKHVSTTYLRSESNTIWARKTRTSEVASDFDIPRGSNVIVLQPGSRNLRIGRASDNNPLVIPSVVARRAKNPTEIPLLEVIPRPTKPRQTAKPGSSSVNGSNGAGDEYTVTAASDEPVDVRIAAVVRALRDRMRFYKLRVSLNAPNITTMFNQQFRPEVVTNDPDAIEWIDSPSEDVLIGDEALRLIDPVKAGYNVRWPIYGDGFNTREYESNQELLEDLEILLIGAFAKLGINSTSYKEYSIIVAVRDYCDRSFQGEFCNILLQSLGFQQMCLQHGSLAATYGAGISYGMVIDIGAKVTSIACVDDGMVIQDSRLTQNVGGDDVTEFLWVLLERISFPYRDVQLGRWYDWHVLEDLKERICSLQESDVALNLYDFVVRAPGQDTRKYGLRAYDETTLAPMCLFDVQIIEYENKRMRPFANPAVLDAPFEQNSDLFSEAMILSTNHLQAEAVVKVKARLSKFEQEIEKLWKNQAESRLTLQQAMEDLVDMSEVAKANTDVDVEMVEPEPQPPRTTETGKPELDADQSSNAGESESDAARPMKVEDTGTEAVGMDEPLTPDLPPLKPTLMNPSGSRLISKPLEELDFAPVSERTRYPGGQPIDIRWEAAKLPIDVACYNSARACGGGEERIRKYLGAVLIAGGSAHLKGFSEALQSRLTSVSNQVVLSNSEKVQVIPPSKDVDPADLVWKGASVLARMDGVQDLWITPEDWELLGMRAVRERSFYM